MIEGKDFYNLLPQSNPMIMVDRLLFHDQTRTVTNFRVTEDNIFHGNGKFTEAGIIENMAQTAAARSGYQAYLNNKKSKTGYIGSIKNLIINELPKTNCILTTEIHQKTEIGNILVIEANVFTDNISVASCEMTVILIDEE